MSDNLGQKLYIIINDEQTMRAEQISDDQVSSAATLCQALEAMFECQSGPESTYYGMSGDRAVPCDGSEKKHQYMTYSCTMDGDDPAKAEKSLAKYLYWHFQNLPKTKLVWRLKPQYETQVKIKFGNEYFSEEGNNTIPEGVEYDNLTGCYRYVAQKTVVHGLRMRLGFPDLEESPCLQLVSHDQIQRTAGEAIGHASV